MKQSLLALSLLLLCAGRSAAQADLKPVDVYPLDYLVPGSYPFGLTVMNIGTTVAPYFNVFWQVDNGPIGTQATTMQFQLAGNMTSSMKVTGNFIADFPSTGLVPIKIWVKPISGQPDANPANDTVVKMVKVMNYLPQKNVLFEVFKHEACCPCLPAAEYENMYIDTMARYSIANIYTGPTDVLLNADGASANAAYNLAHPAPLYDRFKFAYAQTVDRSWYSLDNDYLLEDIGEREKYFEPVEVGVQSANYNQVTGLLTVKLHAKFYDTLSGDFRFNLYLTEDSVMAWQGCATPDEYSYYHMHVVRAMMGGPWGEAGSIPSMIYPGDEADHEFSMTLPATYKKEHMKMIPLVQIYNNDLTKRRVLNSSNILYSDAMTLGVAGGPGKAGDGYVVYPSPVKDVLHIRHEGSISRPGATASIMDLKGVQLREFKIAKDDMEIDVHSLSTGVYFVRVTDGGVTRTYRFIRE